MDTVAVVGLGYVGLPLAVAFGRVGPTIGYDLNPTKIQLYRDGIDPTGEVTPEEFREATALRLTDGPEELSNADFIIVAVPTPVDVAHRPDLRYLRAATQTVGRHLKRGAIVIYESTVYPGCTEEVCIPILESESSREWKNDFFVGYSPERINPGDRARRLPNIVKVVSGDSSVTLEKVAQLYARVVPAGIHRASSIKVAEAAKVIENTQRDLNIALANELAIIFNRLGIDTLEVLEAAGTKWNFLPFRPGLVGGHCIGVDPYYLTYRSEIAGYQPQVVLAGRRINDGMGKYIAEQTIKHMIARGKPIKGSKVGVMGITFKEDCPDLRNSRVADIITELASFGVEIYVHDPIADPRAALEKYRINLTSWDALPRLDALIVAVAHKQYRQQATDAYMCKLADQACVIDVKSILDRGSFAQAGFGFWRL